MPLDSRSTPLRATAVVPVKDGAHEIGACLDALAASEGVDLRVLVVDDGSTDRTAEIAREHGAEVLRLDRCHGPAYARNRGAERAETEVLFFCDADVRVHADTVAVALRALESDPELAAVIGSYDDQPGDPHFIAQFKNLFHRWVHQQSSAEAETFWTGCGAMRREVFLSHGGFDESYPKPSIEDIELGFRLRSSGHRIRLEKGMLAQHTKRWRLWNLIQTDIHLRGAPWIALMLRDKHVSQDLNLSAGARLGTLATLLTGLALLVLPLLGHATAVVPTLVGLLCGVIAAWTLTGARAPSAARDWMVSFGTILAMGAAFWFSSDWLSLLPAVLVMVALTSHLDLHRSFLTHRGAAFVVAAAPMQLVYHLCCAASVPLGIVVHLRSSRPEAGPTSLPALRSIDARPGLARSTDAEEVRA